MYTVELLVDTQFKYQLGLAKSLSDAKSNLSLSKSVASTPLDYLILYPNPCSPQTLLHNLVLGLQLKGDIANSFAKAHALRGPLLVQITFVYLARP